jgi:hypothetical protein
VLFVSVLALPFMPCARSSVFVFGSNAAHLPPQPRTGAGNAFVTNLQRSNYDIVKPSGINGHDLTIY